MKKSSKKIIKIALEVGFVIAVFFAFTWWQNRDLLAVDESQAPDFALQTLEGEVVHLSAYRGQKVLLYFFAPWCTVCRLSADNLNDLRVARTTEELQIFAMALSWDSQAEVEAFVHDLELDVPVLLGYEQQSMDYKIKGFPTYYVIDEAGVIQSRSMGYTTEWGMRIRTWK
ncbi:peroxiredoxin family protein [Marinicella sp. W31]|uniref:peroxiredoxin family protein n=1 Tax=Marinicella sp. W31 TaxID=3023713 RepID=UPI0037580CB0